MKSVIALSVVALATAAQAQVLFSTGWETSDVPSWGVGNIAPQNGWLNVNNAGGHTVRANGFSVSGTPVTAAGGNQFHVTQPSTSTTLFTRYTWGDITPAWNARTAGNDTVRVSMDMFLPNGSTSASRHGIEGYGDAGLGAGSATLGGFFVNAATAGLHLSDAGSAASAVLATVPRNTWFNVSFDYNAVSGLMSLSLNGAPVGTMAGLAAPLAVNDMDLIATNSFNLVTATPGSAMATDNFGISAVPTPGAAALLGVGGLLAARRRRV